MYRQIMHKKVLGFTLAEILLTLVVIGIIAALTVPALINNIQEVTFKAAYKKAIADANQALLMSRDKYYMPCYCEAWYCTGVNENVENGFNSINFSHFKNAFSVAVDCPNDYTKCWADDEMYNDSGIWRPIAGGNDNSPAFVDSQGRSWIMIDGNCLSIRVDINGKKKPNQMGKDRFILYATSQSTVPSSAKISVLSDRTIQDAYNCPKGSCFFQSWLKQ